MEGATSPPGRAGTRSVNEEISRRVVQTLKEHGGTGPPRCRTYIDDDLVIVVMRGGFSRFEQTLFEDGKWREVRTARHAFQDTMEGRLTDVVEEATGRTVHAFMSSSHQGPELQMEVFVLDPVPTPSAAPPPA